MIPRRPWLIGIPALFFIALVGYYSLLVPSTSPPATTPPATAGLLPALEETLEHIYTQVNPSVVNVKVEQGQVVRSPVQPESRGFPSRRAPTPQGPQERIRQGVGSDFVKASGSVQ
jgi:hypothetical protein